MRRTKIIATLGPSSTQRIKEMLEYVDIFRINFAHGDEESHKLYFDIIREAKKDIPILVDLPGPKMRIGDISKEMLLRPGDKIVFSQKEGIPVEDMNFYKMVKKDSEILVADGNIKIKIVNKGEDFAEGIVIEGGILRSRKGINIPETELESGVTPNDLRLLDEALKLGADFIGLSFVLSEKDII
ncbi:MAG TPA: pyruvate kinase, partial [Geobacterales bacterium]|nr:pyruvate kinase [Geobacterales bacterium]